MIIQTEFDYGQAVYLKTDIEQGPYLIGDIQISGGRLVIYQLSQGKYCAWHEEIEISAEVDLCKKYKE